MAYNLSVPVTVTGVEKGGWNVTQLHALYKDGAPRLVPEPLLVLHRTAALLRPGKLRGLTLDYQLAFLFLPEPFFPCVRGAALWLWRRARTPRLG